MLVPFVLVAFVSVSFAEPLAGTCMCLTTRSTFYSDTAGINAHLNGSLSSGECHKFSGGVVTKDGYTWYELQDVHGYHSVWVLSNNLKTSSSSQCSSVQRSRRNTFAGGMLSDDCLQCLCDRESGCRAVGCHYDRGSESCGYFQIKEDYYNDCGKLGTSWAHCADDIYCSSLCVQRYMNRYADYYKCPHTCESFARMHNGGPNGCHRSATDDYWALVQNQSGCSNLP